MRLLISADMEGVAGITHRVQTRRESSEFARACALMTAEVRVACEAAVAAGATSIVVNDAHGDMRNLLHEGLPPDVELIQGRVKRYGMVEGIDPSFDALAFVGYHAAAGTESGILDHTYYGQVAHRVTLMGETCSEARLNAAVAGDFGVPVVFLSGDQAAVADARHFLPWIATAEVKTALGRSAARSLSPQRAQAAIAAGMAEGLTRLRRGECRPYILPPPLTIDVSCMNAEMADNAALLPGGDRIDGTTVRYVAADAAIALRALRVMLMLGSVV